MKGTKKVSVIVPVYNVGKYLAQCIESVQNQEYGNLEIILVDDGSTDDSGKICDSYADRDCRIKVVHKQNAGVSAARNSGMDIATGEYICFVDGDDYVMPDYVGYLYGLIQKDADITLTTEMFGNFDKKQTKKESIEIYTPEKAAEQILCYNIPIGVYCKLFKRSFLSENIRFLSELFIGEGFHFNTTAFQRANHVVAGHRKIYYYRRNNPASATTQFSIEKWQNGLYAIDLIKKDFILHTDKLLEAWKFARWRTYSDVYDVMVLADVQKKYPEMYRKCLKTVRKNALTAFKAPVSHHNRLRAVVMMLCPKMIPWMMLLRRKKYHAEI